MRVAYFISPHGFGHAARAAAVMAAISEKEPAAEFEIYTTVPDWFFEDSLRGPFSYHSMRSDVGLVQMDSFREDLPATIAQLDSLYPLRTDFVSSLAAGIRSNRCSLVVCDIAPLGIAVAKAAGVPSLLVENFTWDWIYEGYLQVEPRLAAHIPYLNHLFTSADYHVQTEPVSCPVTRAFTTPPVSRGPVLPRAEARHRLGLERPTVLVTMGGVAEGSWSSDGWGANGDVLFLLPGPFKSIQRLGNVVHLPHRSGLYHPDLIRAADAVVGKLGYSTCAEVYQSGRPFGYVPRRLFRESATLKRFADRRMSAIEIPEAELQDGSWLERVPRLLTLPPAEPGPNGAEMIADMIISLIEGN